MTKSRAELTAALPLKVFTPDSWAPSVLQQVVPLLCDHAHLERKAASNTLALLHRWPEVSRIVHTPEGVAPDAVADFWVTTISDIALDEINHLNLVVRHIIKRGGSFPKFHETSYGQALRDIERRGNYPDDLVDRLLVSSIIEARSCERFYLLADAAEAIDDRELYKLYSGLWASEHTHYKVFLQLAEFTLPREAVAERMEKLLEQEAAIIQQQGAGPTIHSWI